MPAPVYTANATGNALASQALAANSTALFEIDLTTKFEGQLVVAATFGTIATVAGLRIDCFKRAGTTPVNSTDANFSYTLAAVASSSRQSPAIFLPTGRWHIILTNLDTTNGLTAVSATMDTVDSVT